MDSVTRADEPAGIGARVRAARGRSGWSREELAFRSGISWPAIAQIESGRRTQLRPATLSALAGALDITIDYLVRGTPADAPMLTHLALVYGDEAEFADGVGPFVAEGIGRSEGVIVVTTPANIKRVRNDLGPDAKRAEFVDSAAWYRKPAVTLTAYRDTVRAKLESGAGWVRVVGEPAWTGRTSAEARQWGRYESLINIAFASWPVTVLCPYNRTTLRPKILEQAHATHPELVTDGASPVEGRYVAPDRFVLEADA